MFKRNQIYIALVATSLTLVGTSQAIAQETVSSTATVTVSNAFTLSEVAPLDFGTIRLAYNYNASDFTSGANITVFANGSPSLTAAAAGGGTGAAASITEILPGTPAEYSITAAAPFTQVRVIAAPSATLQNPASPGATLALTVATDNYEIVGGTNPGDPYVQGSGTNMITDGTGAVGFKMGGTITTLLTDVSYGDGAYTGTYTVQVDY